MQKRQTQDYLMRMKMHGEGKHCHIGDNPTGIEHLHTLLLFLKKIVTGNITFP